MSENHAGYADDPAGFIGRIAETIYADDNACADYTAVWHDLAEALVICPVHGCDPEICADDRDDCPAGRNYTPAPKVSERALLDALRSYVDAHDPRISGPDRDVAGFADDVHAYLNATFRGDA